MGQTYRHLFLALFIIALPSPGFGQAQLRPLNTVPSARDVLGSPPSQLVWLRDNLQLVRDPVDGDLVFVDDRGKVLGRAAVPSDFRATKLEVGANEVRFIDAEAGRQFVVRRDVAPNEFRTVAVTDVQGARSVTSDLRRINSRRLAISLPAGRTIDVGAVYGGQLTDAYAIGVDADGNQYVLVEEVVTSAPKLDVRATVERFNAKGELTGVAPIALNLMDVVPRDFVTVTKEGEVRVLVPTATGVQIRASPMKPTKPTDFKRTDKIRLLGVGRSIEASRTIRIETEVQKIDGASEFKGEAGARSQILEPAPRHRDQILSTAKSYLSVNWILNEENWARDGVDNVCDKTSRRFWLRPLHFQKSMIGTAIGPMPYAWGGDDTPASFKDRLTNQRALAGDVCTCRDASLNDCVFFPKAAGVDCSGFVSRAWGLNKLGTAGLLKVSSKVGLQELMPGDAFDWPGHHVRLLVRIDTGPPTIFHVIESATKRDCEGVCESQYRATQLNQYVPIRLHKVLDQ